MAARERCQPCGEIIVFFQHLAVWHPPWAGLPRVGKRAGDARNPRRSGRSGAYRDNLFERAHGMRLSRILWRKLQ